MSKQNQNQLLFCQQ